MSITIKEGDLLRDSVDAIVNTVNCVGVMGKGIALQFKQKWPENFKDYQQACKKGQVQTGQMFIHGSGGLIQPHFIINFPTKRDWREKTKISYIDQGLVDLIENVKKLNIQSIAIPPLGCGLGGLSWKDVKPRIEKAFQALPDVVVHIYEPTGAPNPRTMQINTKKPNMTNGRAALLKLLSIYRQMEYSLNRLEVQKLVYFLEQAGEDLKLEFVKEQYGPYSNKLKHVLITMDGHYLEGVGDHVAQSEITPVKDVLFEADKYLENNNDQELHQRIERVAKLIEGFETPYGMELLASVHWVVNYESDVNNIEDTLRSIKDWNPRKKEIFKDEHIELAWTRLREQDWLNAIH